MTLRSAIILIAFAGVLWGCSDEQREATRALKKMADNAKHIEQPVETKLHEICLQPLTEMQEKIANAVSTKSMTEELRQAGQHIWEICRTQQNEELALQHKLFDKLDAQGKCRGSLQKYEATIPEYEKNLSDALALPFVTQDDKVVAGSALSLACAGFTSRLVGLEFNRIGVCPLEQLTAGIKK